MRLQSHFFRYFSFYNAYIVFKCDNDMPNKQHEMFQIRRDVLNAKYTVRGARLTSTWFMSLFHDFLFDLQDKIDDLRNLQKERKINDPRANDLINGTYLTPKPCEVLGKTKESGCSDDSYFLAYQMLCSVNDTVDCTRVLHTKLIDGPRDTNDDSNTAATANVDSFYNLLTAWYNVEQMMYGVSQAEFQPAPPKWTFKYNITKRKENLPRD